ncbi:carbohydrate-binding protein [Halanaerobacter jeridensis]|uniref:CBM21 domain-containing protein n=1 Tax=Halanaerobacter jeridensis TaxID=706427 RepID=A0A938XYA4_9FIRM|nr:hypothetical protein [Halanaerobacter jeridensis]
MDTSKKFYKGGLFLSLLFLVLAGGVILSTAEAAANAVELSSAKITPLYTKRGVLEGYKTTGCVVIKESGYNEEVVVHYSYGYDNWKQVKGEFVGTNKEGHQIWEFETPANKPSFHYYKFTTEFAVNYKKDGQNYWANNGGENYFLRMTNVPNFSNRPIIMGSNNVLLEDSRYHQYNDSATLLGEIVVKNLDYNKNVQVVYTTDNWATTETITANYYTSYDNQLEKWGFVVRNLPADANVKYRIKYNVNGKTYWDNNFGRDYQTN